jgi:hypothetical protein
MVGVPAVWETIRKGIVGKVTAGGRVRESVFRGAVEAKRRCVFFLDTVLVSSDGLFFTQGHTRAGQARGQRGAERGEGRDGREVCGFLCLGVILFYLLSLHSFYLDSYPRILPPHFRSSILTHHSIPSIACGDLS